MVVPSNGSLRESPTTPARVHTDCAIVGVRDHSSGPRTLSDRLGSTNGVGTDATT